jgi:2-keto-4-pentenoate hydratase
MDGDMETLARDLARAWRDGGMINLPPSGPVDRAQAYAIQDRMAALIGGAIGGWKVGATVPAVRVFEGHDAPLPGRIFADRLFTSPARIEARLVPGMKIECEFAFRLRQDMPRGSDGLARDALAALLDFHPAVEITGGRYAPGTGGRAATTFDGIADNGSGAAAVIGEAAATWRELHFETLPIEARIDGSPALQVYGGAYRRDPVVIIGETLDDLRARGITLARGQVILTGSLTLPTPLRRGQTLTARFADFAPLVLSAV